MIEIRSATTRGWRRLIFADRSAEITDAMAAEIERLQRETGTPKIDDEMQKRLKALNIEF